MVRRSSEEKDKGFSRLESNEVITVSIEVYIKRNIAIHPPSWDDSYLPMQAYEELHSLLQQLANVNRDQEDETYRGKTVMYYPNNFQAVIENYQLSERFILIDLLRPVERLKNIGDVDFRQRKSSANWGYQVGF